MKRDYKDPLYTDWRKKVLKRDKNRCRMPCCKKRGKLQVHHIRKWSTAPLLRYDPDNGISLCFGCHKEVNKYEHIYEAMFMEIVKDIKNGLQ